MSATPAAFRAWLVRERKAHETLQRMTTLHGPHSTEASDARSRWRAVWASQPRVPRVAWDRERALDECQAEL